MKVKDFTKDELKILAIDYKSLLDVDLIMKRTISGKDMIAAGKMLSIADKLRLSIFEKVKIYLPKTKKQLPTNTKSIMIEEDHLHCSRCDTTWSDLKKAICPRCGIKLKDLKKLFK